MTSPIASPDKSSPVPSTDMVSPIASPDKILPIASTNLPLPIASTDDLISMIESKKKSGLLNRTNVIIAAVGLIAIASATTFYLLHGSGNQVHYVTELSTMGRLIVTASASGTLQPTKSVDIGSELSGTLVSVLAQENEQVKKGQLLAELEPSKLVDAVSKSRAALAAADARVLLAQATVAEARAMHARMLDVSRLSAGKVPAKTEMETASATLQRAIANETSAKSDVMQAKAALKTDETNLSKAKITSPVNGVVLTRKVEPGNTVAATMTTPVLFVIAEDLSNMELQVKVDEADVANVKEAQPASFTVSAWPGRIFPAHIERVGLGSTITDNVVTYKTVLRVANIDLALRPGMTATATIVTAERLRQIDRYEPDRMPGYTDQRRVPLSRHSCRSARTKSACNPQASMSWLRFPGVQSASQDFCAGERRTATGVSGRTCGGSPPDRQIGPRARRTGGLGRTHAL